MNNWTIACSLAKELNPDPKVVGCATDNLMLSVNFERMLDKGMSVKEVRESYLKYCEQKGGVNERVL